MAWSVKYDPTLPGSNTPVAPATGGVALAGQVPIIGQGIKVTPPSGALTAIGAAGALGLGVTPTSGAIVVAGQPPTISTSGGATFDYYISTTGSDSNAGTLASPWAITAINTKGATYAGKRVGLLPGTYGVSSLMISAGGNYNNIAIDIAGGSAGAVTYIGSSDAGGHYSARTATIQGNDNGLFGGGNANKCSMIGQSSNVGYLTIDGLVITGASLWCLTIGQTAGTNTSPPNVTIKNCEFTGNSAQNCTVASGENCAVVQLMSGVNFTLTNNYIHDNYGWTDNQHFAALYHWGLGTGTHGSVITYNTIVNSGCLHGKEATQYDATIAYNYIDMTLMTPGGTGGYTAPIIGFLADGGNGTLTAIHHNVLISYGGGGSPSGLGGTWIDLTFDTGQSYWDYPVHVYNNTMVASAALNGCGFEGFEKSGVSGIFQYYNNLMYDNGVNAVGQYGYMFANSDVFSVCDYNIYGTHNKWSVASPGVQNTYSSQPTTLAGWQSAISADAHSITNSSNPFTSGGTFAKQFQVQSGSPAYGFGHVGGTSGGSAVNAGAWDGSVTQIGCDFA